MKTLFALVTSKDELLAIHNKSEIVHEYFYWLVKHDQHNLVEGCSIKKYPKSYLKKQAEYPELYLVRSGDEWLPAGYCSRRKEIAEAESYEYKQARDMLYKLCEMREFGSKEVKAIATVIEILQSEIDCIDDCHYDPLTLREVNEMNRWFRDRVNDDN